MEEPRSPAGSHLETLLGDCFGGKKAGAELLKPNISLDRNHLRPGWREAAAGAASVSTAPVLSQQPHPKGGYESRSKHSHPSTTSTGRTQPMLSDPAPGTSQQRGLVWEFRPILRIPGAAAAPSAPAYGRKTTIRSPATLKLATAVAGYIPATCNHGLTLNNLFSSAKPRSSRPGIITEPSPGPQSCRHPASTHCSVLPIKHFGEVFGSDPCPRPALRQQ